MLKSIFTDLKGLGFCLPAGCSIFRYFCFMRTTATCIVFILMLTANNALAQATNEPQSERQVIQFSGLVVTGDSLTPVPFTTVFRQRDKRGSITDNLGFFSIPALAGDTIRFSCIGYLPARYVIPDSLSSARYEMVQLLRRDTVELETTFIYPWPTKERFRKEFLSLELPDTKEDIARRNLEATALYERMNQLDPDAREAYRYAMQRNTHQIAYAGMVPTTGLISPMAWAQFFNAWRSGAFKKQ